MRPSGFRMTALKHSANCTPPKKPPHAQVEYLLPGYKKDRPKDQSIWTTVRDCDALLHVVRNHAAYGFEKPTPAEDFIKLDQEFILSDLVVIEKRLERLELDRQRGNRIDKEEQALMDECRTVLENETPIQKKAGPCIGPQTQRVYIFKCQARSGGV